MTLNDINQLKTRVKSVGITFNEMNEIQVKQSKEDSVPPHKFWFFPEYSERLSSLSRRNQNGTSIRKTANAEYLFEIS